MDQTVAKGSHFDRAKRLVFGTVKAFMDPDVSLRCAGTAFFGFLSLFPAIGIVAFTVPKTSRLARSKWLALATV